MLKQDYPINILKYMIKLSKSKSNGKYGFRLEESKISDMINKMGVQRLSMYLKNYMILLSR